MELAALPEQIRGFGYVREAHAKRLEPQRSALRAALSDAQAELLAA